MSKWARGLPTYSSKELTVWPDHFLDVLAYVGGQNYWYDGGLRVTRGVQVVTSIVVGVVSLLALIGIGGYFLVVKVRSRLSPRYAAQRELRAKQESDRWWEKRQRRRAEEKGRLLNWARQYPSDPVAKGLLASQASPTASASSASVEVDPAELLRTRQREADEMARHLEARRLEEELLAQRLIEWAIEHATTPEAQRHLVETLEALAERVRKAESDIMFANFRARGDDVAEIEISSRIADAEARRAAAEMMASRIREALAAAVQEAPASE